MNGIGNIKSACLDTAVFIYYFEKNPEFGHKSKLVFQQLIEQNAKISTGIITLTELLSAPNIPNPDHLREQFSQTPNLTVFPINEQIALEAARIRREYKFKLGDSLQLATAITAKSELFITNDIHLKSFSELKVILLTEIN